MATVSEERIGEADEVVRADPVDEGSQGAADHTPSGEIRPTENWEVELSTFKTNEQNNAVNEPCVIAVATDETDTNWKNSRYNYSMSLSSSVTDLYSALAKEAGYIEGTFDLIWRKQVTDGPSEEEVVLEWKSTATLHEMGMLTEPVKTYLLIREKDGAGPPQKVHQDPPVTTSTSVASSSKSSSPPSTKMVVWNNSSYSNYNYSYNAKSDTGFVGLVNQAMTCYLNSLLQSLYMTPEFRNAMYSWQFNSDEKPEKCIPYQLQRLFIQLQMSNKRAVETTDVTKSFGWDSSEAWQQHDVQELCRVMFDALERRFKKDQQKKQQPQNGVEGGESQVRVNLINELYQGTMKDYVKCLTCGYESARVDHFLDIPLVIKPFGLQTAFASMEEALQGFVQPETLEGDNQYFCEHCNKKCDAHKGLKFLEFPYLLTLQLKRFDFDYSTMHRIKLNDRMTFPKVLDLNGFVEPSELPKVAEDVEERYRDFLVERFDPPPRPPPYSYYSRQGYGSSSYDSKYKPVGTTYTIKNYTETTATKPTIQISEEGGEGGDTSHDQSHDPPEETEEIEPPPTVAKLMTRGPYVYELFSIMIHSGSAIGGHYYAYIKSFADKQWYCFNDQSVTKITEEDIEQTYGGQDSRSRGYYSSMYASSANAYMLMYRRVDLDENKPFVTAEALPQHIKEQIETEREYERREKERQEWEKNLCKFRLFCKHPRTGELVERSVEVHKDTALSDVTEKAYRVLELKSHVSLDRCRLVRYDEYTEALDQSFEEQQGVSFGQMVGGARQHYSYELYMEIRGEKEVFKPYKRGGLNLKTLVIDLSKNEVRAPVFIRAEQGWKVADLKAEIAEKLHLDPEVMNLAIETYQSEGRHLPQPHQFLKNEGFYRKHTVFVCCDPEDFKRDFKDSAMNKVIDRHANSILLHITIPPPPRKKAAINGAPDGNVGESSVHQEEGSQAVGGAIAEGESSVHQEERSQAVGGAIAEGESSVHREEGSQAVGGAIAEGERTDTNGQPQEASGSSDPPHSEDTQTPVPMEVSDQPEGESRREGEGESKGEGEGKSKGEGERESRREGEGESKRGGEGESRREGEGESKRGGEGETGGGAAETEEDRPLQRTIEQRIDRRCTLAELKKTLEDKVQQSSDNFKIYRVYNNNQEYEMFRLNDSMTTIPNETRLIVRLGRALKPGEFRIKLSLLRMKEVEFFKPIMDSIVAKGMAVRTFKERIVKEAYEQGIEYPLQLDRFRLRKKTWRSAGTIYLDDQIIEKDIHVFANFEMYVEPLEGPDPMTHATQMQVYIRRWRQSTYTVDPTEEIILDENSPEHLRKRLSEASGIPWERVEFAKGYGSFPCEISALDIEDDLDWNPNVTTISSMPLSIYDDGAIIYYKDSAEKPMDMSPEKRNEIQKQEQARLTKYNIHGTSYNYRYHMKERALKIYTDDDETKDERND